VSSLSPDEIELLLKQEAVSPTSRTGGRSTRGPKVDPTLTRDTPTWYRLQHHLCTEDCEHRKDSPTERACWNPECKDPRDLSDRGTNIVVRIKDKYTCRYCFLDGWLL
jgi:hypothetical protein